MRVLVGCEFSGRVRDAFIRAGHEAISCDLLPSLAHGPHIQGDVLKVLHQDWDLGIFFPPCTYLTSAGLHWNARREGRIQQTEDALSFVSELLGAPIPFIALENPVGCISTRIREPDQIIQPYDFGEDASKATCLWLKGLPLLQPVRRVTGRYVIQKARFVERWANQTDSGQNKLAPNENRWKDRAETYHGIAEAMADQWSHINEFELTP